MENKDVVKKKLIKIINCSNYKISFILCLIIYIVLFISILNLKSLTELIFSNVELFFFICVLILNFSLFINVKKERKIYIIFSIVFFILSLIFFTVCLFDIIDKSWIWINISVLFLYSISIFLSLKKIKGVKDFEVTESFETFMYIKSIANEYLLEYGQFCNKKMYSKISIILSFIINIVCAFTLSLILLLLYQVSSYGIFPLNDNIINMFYFSYLIVFAFSCIFSVIYILNDTFKKPYNSVRSILLCFIILLIFIATISTFFVEKIFDFYNLIYMLLPVGILFSKDLLDNYFKIRDNAAMKIYLLDYNEELEYENLAKYQQNATKKLLTMKTHDLNYYEARNLYGLDYKNVLFVNAAFEYCYYYNIYERLLRKFDKEDNNYYKHMIRIDCQSISTVDEIILKINDYCNSYWLLSQSFLYSKSPLINIFLKLIKSKSENSIDLELNPIQNIKDLPKVQVVLEHFDGFSNDQDMISACFKKISGFGMDLMFISKERIEINDDTIAIEYINILEENEDKID